MLPVGVDQARRSRGCAEGERVKAQRMPRTYWYTAVRDGKRIVAISGPYPTKEAADAFVAEPSARDRRIAEALDCKAVFYHYMTIETANPVPTIIERPDAQKILTAKGLTL